MTSAFQIMGRVSVPLVTPFTDSENLNLPTLGQLVEFVIRRDYCDSIIFTGTTGEFYALSDEERTEVWTTGMEAVAGRVPVIAGVGSASTRGALKLARAAESIGFDMVMVVLPYYSRPTQQGIEQHFRAIAESVSLPVLIYNIPLFTGINMEPETLERLARVPNIVGVKEEASVAPTQATAFALRTPESFSIYCGDDTMVLQVLPQRGVGVVSGGSAVVGRWMKAMIAAYYDGDNRAASAIYFRLAPFFAALNQSERINPIPILRGAIEMASGIRIGPPRRPLLPATHHELAVIRPILEGLKLQEVGNAVKA